MDGVVARPASRGRNRQLRIGARVSVTVRLAGLAALAVLALGMLAAGARADGSADFVGTWLAPYGNWTITSAGGGTCAGKTALAGYTLIDCTTSGDRYSFVIAQDGTDYRSTNTGTISGNTIHGEFHDSNGADTSYVAVRKSQPGSLLVSVEAPLGDRETGTLKVGTVSEVRVTVSAQGSDFTDIFLTGDGLVALPSCGAGQALAITDVPPASYGFSLAAGDSRVLVFKVSALRDGAERLEVNVRGEASDGQVMRTSAESVGIRVGPPDDSGLTRVGPPLDSAACARSTSARASNPSSSSDS